MKGWGFETLNSDTRYQPKVQHRTQPASGRQYPPPPTHRNFSILVKFIVRQKTKFGRVDENLSTFKIIAPKSLFYVHFLNTPPQQFNLRKHYPPPSPNPNRRNPQATDLVLDWFLRCMTVSNFVSLSNLPSFAFQLSRFIDMVGILLLK